MGLLSLFYMLDFACCESQCKELLNAREETLSASERRWIDQILDANVKSQNYMRGWHILLGVMELAEFYLRKKEYTSAIQECDDLLEIDCTKKSPEAKNWETRLRGYIKVMG